MISSPARLAVLEIVAGVVLAVAREDRVTLVAVDGVDGAGKTTFGDELSAAITGRHVIRASVDSFHRPRAQRHARGRESPEGFYRDSYDYAALERVLLEPIRAGRTRTQERS